MFSIDITTLLEVLETLVNSRYFPPLYSTNPSDWDGEEFSELFSNHILDEDKTTNNTKVSKAFGIPKNTPINSYIIENGGTGLNGNRFFKLMNRSGTSWKGGLYDVWAEIQQKYRKAIDYDMG